MDLPPSFTPGGCRRQLVDAYPCERAKLTVGIFFEVGLNQRGVIARAHRLPKRQFDFPVMRIAHADGVSFDRLETNSGKSDKLPSGYCSR